MISSLSVKPLSLAVLADSNDYLFVWSYSRWSMSQQLQLYPATSLSCWKWFARSPPFERGVFSPGLFDTGTHRGDDVQEAQVRAALIRNCSYPRKKYRAKGINARSRNPAKCSRNGQNKRDRRAWHHLARANRLLAGLADRLEPDKGDDCQRSAIGQVIGVRPRRRHLVDEQSGIKGEQEAEEQNGPPKTIDKDRQIML